MHPAQIKALLAMAGTSQAQIARDLGISDAQVSYALNDKPGYAATRRHIASVLNRSVEELWPPKESEIA